MNCPVCSSSFIGEFARSSLLRHVRSSDDEAHRRAHQDLKVEQSKLMSRRSRPIDLKKQRDTRYKEKHPEKSQATKRFSRIKAEVLKEFAKQHEDRMPKLPERPEDPNLLEVSASNNRYWLLEEHLSIFAGRREPLYTWDDVNKILLEHYNTFHGPGRKSLLDGERCSRPTPLLESIFERDSEDVYEWDSFLRYNQAIIKSYFDLQEWDDIRRNYERKMRLWAEFKFTEDQVLQEAHFRYRKKWKSHYNPDGDIQRPVKTRAATDNTYPQPNFKTLQTRIINMAGELRGIMNPGAECARLKQAISEGWLQTRGAQEMDCNGMNYSHAGYYGSKGASKILSILNTHVQNLCPPKGTQSYLKLLQYVVVPEVAIRLIMEDNHVDYDQASVIWEKSRESGPVDDDEIYDDDDDDD